MAAVAQRLQSAGLPMWEFPQTIANLTESSTILFELIKGSNLVAYPDPDLKLAVSRAVALESARGWYITKSKTLHKIDIVVALAAVPIVVTSPWENPAFSSVFDNYSAWAASRGM